MIDQEYLCDTCSHDADCEIEEQRTEAQGCMLYVKNGHTEAAPNVVLCDSCGKTDECSAARITKLLPGETCEWGYEDIVLVDVPEETSTYTVAEIINGFEDMFRRGLDDLATELKKHDMSVESVSIDQETMHEFVVGKAFPQIAGQTFEVGITVTSIRKA